MVVVDAVFGVVVADDVQSRCELVLCEPFVIASPCAQRHRDRAAGIELLAQPHHAHGLLRRPIARALEYLVADRPHRHARMHPVAPHHRLERLRPIPFEIARKIGLALAFAPHIEHVVDDEKPLFVASFEKRLGERIAAEPHRVEAGFLEFADLPALGVGVAGRPERARIVVHTSAVQIDGDGQNAERRHCAEILSLSDIWRELYHLPATGRKRKALGMFQAVRRLTAKTAK